MKNSELQLLEKFLTHAKEQGSYEKFYLVEGFVLDFLEEEYRMNMRFVNGTLKEEK